MVTSHWIPVPGPVNFISFLFEAHEAQEEGSRQEPSLPSVSMCSTGWVSSRLALFWVSDRASSLWWGLDSGWYTSSSEKFLLVIFLSWPKKPCFLLSLVKQFPWMKCSTKGCSCSRKKIFPRRQLAKSKLDTWFTFVKYLTPDQDFKFFPPFLGSHWCVSWPRGFEVQGSDMQNFPE